MMVLKAKEMQRFHFFKDKVGGDKQTYFIVLIWENPKTLLQE